MQMRLQKPYQNLRQEQCASYAVRQPALIARQADKLKGMMP